MVYPQIGGSCFSARPYASADGIHEAFPGSGYGSVSYQGDGAVTYPALYLSNDDPLTGQNLVVISGYDPALLDNCRALFLELFINYAEKTLHDLQIYAIPLQKELPKNVAVNYKLLVSDGYLNEAEKKSFYFTIKQTEGDYTISEIPIDHGDRFLRFNLTGMQCRYGVVLRVAEHTEPAYRTTDANRIITGSGQLEFASPRWQEWDGRVDPRFTIREYRWKTIINRGYGSVHYLPRLIIYRNR